MASGPWVPVAAAAAAVVGVYYLTRRPGAPGPAPIIVKGEEVSLGMTDGTTLRAPPSYGMIHDPSGVYLPPDDVFVGPFRVLGEDVRLDEAERQYFGRSYRGTLAEVRPPERGWRRAGAADAILYTRDRGKYAARAPYIHRFGRPVPVAQSGAWLRLELPAGSVVNWRGFVRP